jgi:microcystin-dependent protein
MGTYYNDNGELKLISGATLWADAPIGAINAYGGATAPNGWLLCHGQAISRTGYAELFAVIGTAYGSGDGSTTFNVPDLRESTIKGAGLTGLSNNHMDSDGLAVGEFIDDRLQSHSHNTYLTGVQVSNGGAWATAHDYSANGTHTSGPESPARSGDTTEVKAVGANFIIKAKQVALPADFMGALDNKQDATDDNLETTDKTVVGAINELKDDLSTKQNKTDNNLTTTSKQIVGAINELNDDLTVKGQSVVLYTGTGGDFTTPIPDDSKYLIVRINTPNGGNTTKFYPTELIRAIPIHESAYWNTINYAGYDVLAVYDITETSITPIVFNHGPNTGDISVSVTSIN